MSADDIQLGVDGYCTLAAVEATLPALTFTATSQPTRVQAGIIVKDYFDDINARLYVCGYEVPVGSAHATGIQQLAHLNMLGAAAQIELSHGTLNDMARTNDGGLYDQYDKTWSMIRKKRMTMGLTQRSTYFPTRKQQQPGFQFTDDGDGQETAMIFTDNAEF